MHLGRIIYNILCWENDDFGTTMFSVMLLYNYSTLLVLAFRHYIITIVIFCNWAKLLTHHWRRLYSVPWHLARHWAAICHIRKILFVIWVKVRLRRRRREIWRWKGVDAVIDQLLIICLSLHVCHFLEVVFVGPRGAIKCEIVELLGRNLNGWLCWILNLLYRRRGRFPLHRWFWFTLGPLLLLVLLSKLCPPVFKPYLGKEKCI